MLVNPFKNENGPIPSPDKPGKQITNK